MTYGPALLVDGVGRTLDQEIVEGITSIDLPFPDYEPTSTKFGALPRVIGARMVTFDLIGELPGGRRVFAYRYRSRPFIVWRCVLSYRPTASATEIESQKTLKLQALNLVGPCRVLHDVVNPSLPEHRRMLAGVARKALV